MRKLLAIACLGLLTTPAQADTYAEFDPGLYAYSIQMEVMGTTTNEFEEDCITEADRRITAQTIEEEMPGGVSCTYSDVITSPNSVSATVDCYLSEEGMHVKGPSHATWTSTSFKLVIDGKIQMDELAAVGEIPAKMTIDGSRIGVCN